VIGVYGGYFGGAQGILLVGALGTMMTESLQRLNALKNGLVTAVNTVAAVTFLVLAFRAGGLACSTVAYCCRGR